MAASTKQTRDEQDQEILKRLKAKHDVPDVKEQMEAMPPEKDIPADVENCIEVNGKLINIKPTKLKYFANNSVSFYDVLDKTPLPMVYKMVDNNDSNFTGEGAILLFMSAVLDDASLAKRIYREMDAGQLLKMLEIFKRLNGIAEREETLKKMKAVSRE